MFVPEPLEPGRYGAAEGEPVRIGRKDCALVQIMARRGGAEVLAEALRAGLALALPPPGRSGGTGEILALPIQPDGWLIQGPRDSDSDLAATLTQICGASASVIDQSDGRAVFTLAGAQARAVLARLCRLDLHPSVFQTGQVAVTPLGGLSAVLHQAGVVDYQMIVASSYGRAFGRMLARAAAPVGYEVI